MRDKWGAGWGKADWQTGQGLLPPLGEAEKAGRRGVAHHWEWKLGALNAFAIVPVELLNPMKPKTVIENESFPLGVLNQNVNNDNDEYL